MLVTLLLLQAAATAPVAGRTGKFRSPRVTESSGVVVSRANPRILWTHNDSGDDAYLYATDLQGADRGAIRVSGAKNNDWEDLGLGPCPLGSGVCLYIGDTGDNLRQRSRVTVYAVPEPEPPRIAADTQRVTAAAYTLKFRYPDGSNDVEALYVSPGDTAVYLVSKGNSGNGKVRLYRLRHSAWQQDRVATAELVQILPISTDRAHARLVTGAAVRPDGALVAIRTYGDLHFFRPSPDGRLVLTRHSTCSLTGSARGGEAVAFLDDSTLVLTSEAGTIHVVRCPA